MRAPWNKRRVNPSADRVAEAEEALDLAKEMRVHTVRRMERRAEEIKANHFAEDIKRYLEVRPPWEPYGER